MEPETKNSFKLPHVEYNAIIDIKVSGMFLKRCQVLLIALGEKMGKDKLLELYKKFKDTDQNPADLNEAMIFILTALVNEMERGAIEQGKVKEMDITAEQASKLFGES